MPKIYEIFGYPISDRSPAAETNRKKAWCPFMDAPCDGGGNRYLSHIDSSKDPYLKEYFKSKNKIPSGVCSIQLHKNESPWIVCPRRLLCLGRDDSGQRKNQGFAEALLLKKCPYPIGTKLGVWSEMKIKYSQSDKMRTKHFDYTFDYIIMPVSQVEGETLSQLLNEPWNKLRKTLEEAGYSLSKRNGKDFVEAFPAGIPTIVEIMTSSTSGGNQKKRSTIPMAFADAIKGIDHMAPGINYRQVWARMVSQLIVKSEVALEWGGNTIWILQDKLIDYISNSTALDIHAFLSEKLSEVNILGLSYGDSFTPKSGVIELREGVLFAGPIGPKFSVVAEKSFQDMVKAPICPPKELLLKLLAKRNPTRIITA